VQVGQIYVVTPENYGHYVFSYWNDTRSTAASRSIDISRSTTLVAIYTQIADHLKINVRAVALSGEDTPGTHVAAFSSSAGISVPDNTFSLVTSGQTNIIFSGNSLDY
jgi:hypothetical protein